MKDRYEASKGPLRTIEGGACVENRLLTPDEVADRLQVSRLTVMSYLRSGVLKGIKVGRLWRVSEEELGRFLATPRRPGVSMVSHASRRGYPGDEPPGYGGRVPPHVVDDSDSRWLDAGVEPPLPAWDWGPKGRPKGKPVKYVPGVGLVIEGRKRGGE